MSEPESPQPPQQMQELTRDNLETFEALELVATVAAALLKRYGQATFVVQPNGTIAWANPVHVYIHPQATEVSANKDFRYVRPIIGDGKPNYAALKDGVLWEVEFVDEQPQAKPGS